METDNQINFFQPYSPEEYLEFKVLPEDFPKEIYIAYAVCGKDCGYSEFIVDGQTQFCRHCHRQMLRTEVRKYVLADDPK